MEPQTRAPPASSVANVDDSELMEIFTDSNLFELMCDPVSDMFRWTYVRPVDYYQWHNDTRPT